MVKKTVGLARPLDAVTFRSKRPRRPRNKIMTAPMRALRTLRTLKGAFSRRRALRKTARTLDNLFETEGEDETEDSVPSRTGHKIDAHHLAQLAATVLWRLPSSGSDAVTGTEESYESNMAFGDDSNVGRLVRLRRWRDLVWQETHPEDENGAIASKSDDGPFGEPPAEEDPSEPSEIWDGGSEEGWHQFNHEWDVNGTSQTGRATLEVERLAYGNCEQYALVGAEAKLPRSSLRNTARKSQGRAQTDGAAEDDSWEVEAELVRESYLGEAESDAPETGNRTGDAVDGQETSESEAGDGRSGVEEDHEGDGSRDAGTGSTDDHGSRDGDTSDERSEADQQENDDAEDAQDSESSGNGSCQDDINQPVQQPILPQQTTILAPAGGQPNHDYPGPRTRTATAAQKARQSVLQPGEAYISIPIAESRAAQMLLVIYGGESIGEDSEDQDGEDGQR